MSGFLALRFYSETLYSFLEDIALPSFIHSLMHSLNISSVPVTCQAPSQAKQHPECTPTILSDREKVPVWVLGEENNGREGISRNGGVPWAYSWSDPI